jgi:hypothetical protein
LYHRTWEVGDGVGDGDGERSVDALAAHGYVLTEEALRDLERPEKEEALRDLERPKKEEATGREKARRSPFHLEVVRRKAEERETGKPRRRVRRRLVVKLGWRTA